MPSLTDIVNEIKTKKYIYESELDSKCTINFESHFLGAIKSTINNLTVDKIINDSLPNRNVSSYKFKYLIYKNECKLYGGLLTKKFKFDIHNLVANKLNLTDFEIDIQYATDDGHNETIYIYITELNKESLPTYFEYFNN